MSSYSQVSSPSVGDGNCAPASDYPSRAFPSKGKVTRPSWKPLLLIGGRGGSEEAFKNERTKARTKSGTHICNLGENEMQARVDWIKKIEALLEFARDEDLSDFPKQGLMKDPSDYTWFG